MEIERRGFLGGCVVICVIFVVARNESRQNESTTSSGDAVGLGSESVAVGMGSESVAINVFTVGRIEFMQNESTTSSGDAAGLGSESVDGSIG